MWFRFPEGTTQISIEQQIFEAEVTAEDGSTYFRAPDHFAPTILGLGGFTRVAEDQLPKGAPPDLPKDDPARAAAIDVLSADHAALKEQYQLQVDQNAAMHKELQDALTQLDGARKEIAQLQEALDKVEDAKKAGTKK